MSGYCRYSYRVPADLEDIFSAELWARGTAGIESRDSAPGSVRLEAYFPESSSADGDPIPEEAWERRGVVREAVERVPAQDWLATYRETAIPFEVGHRFLIDPRDAERSAEDAGGDRIRLRIPAQNAFGTGTHASTRLVLEWLEDLDLAGRPLLDVGSGSGILSFAALALGASPVVGFDLDLPSVLTARRNRRLNGLYPRFLAATVSALNPQRRFQVALVNILPERILDAFPRLLACLAPGALVLSSGNLTTRRRELLREMTRLGLRLEAERSLEEWSAFLLRVPA